MRIRLTLLPLGNCIIPINYQYELSSAIYKILSKSSTTYSDWLHNHGYIDTNGKPRKLFTFSFINFRPRAIPNDDTLKINPDTETTLYVSSPLLEDFIQNFVQGIFINQNIEIGNHKTVGRFSISRVETMPSPEFKNIMRYRCLSPILVSTKKEYNGKLNQYYLRPDDPDLSRIIESNLIEKYTTTTKKNISVSDFKFKLDQNYVKKRGGFDKITKLLTLNKDEKQIKVKSFVSPFTLEADTELQRIAYECGIGEKNSQGFGMIEVEEE